MTDLDGRLQQLSDWWQTSFLGAVMRQADSLRLGTAALALGAQEVLCTAPMLVALSAVMARFHLGYVGSFLDDVMGLDNTSALEVRQLFHATRTAQLESLWLGLAAAAVFYVSVASSTQAGVEAIWGRSGNPWRAWRSRIIWVLGQTPMFVLALGGGRILHRQWHLGADASNLAYAVTMGVSAGLFHWWGHHLLLEKRVPYRALAPGSLVLAGGVLILGLVSPWIMPGQIKDNVADYGLIGAAFILSLWAVTYSAIVMYATLAGQVYWARHQPEHTTGSTRVDGITH